MKTLLAALLAAFALPALAQDYPSKPIRMIVGYAPGGGTDIMARVVATRLSTQLGESVVVENRPGNSGIVGAVAVKNAPPDGYTIMMGVMSLNTIQPNLQPNLPFDPIKDFTPVNLVASVPHFIVVPPSLGVDTVAGLIDYAKKNPGKISYPSAGTGTSSHLGGEMFRLQGGNLNMVHIPYKSAGHSMPDLLAGRVHVGFETLPTTVTYVRTGKLKALAVTTPKRLPEFPDVPTAIESGLPEYRLRTWYGVFAPAGTPAPIVNKLHAEIAKAVMSPEARPKLKEMGVDDSVTATPADFAAMVRSELAHFGKLIKDAGIKLTE